MKKIIFEFTAPLVLAAGCVTAQKNAFPETSWINNMHRLSAAHLYILPKAADGAKFSDPALKAPIAGELRAMAETATAIANDPRAPDADPLIRYTANAFAADLRQAYASFQANDPQLARFTIGRSSRYCIGCHTRADRGLRDFDVGWSSELSGLSPAQKIEFFLANRRYRSALSEAKAMAREDQTVRREPRAWLLALERTLGMVVRVNDDPAQAEDLAMLAFANKAAPNYARREAAGWVRDIREWKDDKRRGHSDRFRLAVTLIETRPSLVRQLRASAILHEILENSNSPHYAEAMLYSGMAAAAMRELNMGQLDQYYYEACIGRAPHSELSERCYAKLEDSVRAGNPMMALDPDMAMEADARLNDLRRLSETRDPGTDPSQLWRDKRPEPPEKGR